MNSGVVLFTEFSLW